MADRLGDAAEADRIIRASDGAIAITATQEKRIAQTARLEADAWTAECEAKCRQVLIDHNSAGEYVPARVRLLLMQAVRSYIGSAPGSATFGSKGRPMKVRNIEAHVAWESKHLPYLAKLRVDLAAQNMRGLKREARDKSLPAEARTAARERSKAWERYALGEGPQPERIVGPRLRDSVSTATSRLIDGGLVDDAAQSPEVAYLQWTNYPELAMSGQSCDYCESLNGLVVPKASPFVGTNSPPIHPNCHCRWGLIPREWAKKHGIKATPKRQYPEGEPAEGWGGFTPHGAAAKKK